MCQLVTPPSARPTSQVANPVLTEAVPSDVTPPIISMVSQPVARSACFQVSSCMPGKNITIAPPKPTVSTSRNSIQLPAIQSTIIVASKVTVFRSGADIGPSSARSRSIKPASPIVGISGGKHRNIAQHATGTRPTDIGIPIAIHSMNETVTLPNSSMK